MARILVVDDRAENRDFLLTLLGYGGHEIFQASDGSAALSVARRHPPDLVITDLLMPTMDGFEFVRRLREQPLLAKVRVVFWTATYLESDARSLADACGVKHILTKPAEPQDVLRVVAEELQLADAPAAPVASLEEFRSEHLRLLSMTLAYKAEVVVPRLSALIELSVELASEPDPSRLLDMFCSGTRKILGAKYALVHLVDTARGHDDRVFSSGLDARAARRVGPDWPLQGELAKVVRERRPYFGRADPAELGLPEGLPPARGFAAVAVQSPKKVYGWLCLADRVGGGEFSEEEGQLAATLGGLAGRIYENGSLYLAARRTVEDLRESEERFRQITTHVEEVFWMTDPAKSRMLYVSPAYEVIWGRSPQTLYEQPSAWLAAIHPDDRPRVTAALPRQKAGTYDEEYRIVRPDGSIRWIRDRAFPVRDAGGGVYRVVGVAADVTDRKQATDDLRESERRFSGMLANLRLVSLMLDREGRITYCNDYLLDLTGYRREEVVGRNWFEVFVPANAESRRKRFAAVLADLPEARHYESEILTREGRSRLIRWNNSVLRSSTGEVLGTASIGEDITEHKRMEEQLRLSQKMEAVGRLAGGVAHDFNNVLGVIIGYGEMLRRSIPEESGERRKLDQILRAADRAAGLTRQLLAFSRKQVLEPRILKPSALVGEMQKMLGRLIGEDVELVLRLGGMGRVKADPGQLEQVVMNLVVNARDAMPMGGRLVIETGDVELEEPLGQAGGEAVPAGRFVTVGVSDTGHGIDAATRAWIFEPFFTTKSEGKGTGLGLSTVYGIVTQSGGHIWMDSEVGKGTTFRVYLPMVDAPISEERERIPTARRRGTETLLVVEDESAARDLVAEVLREEGYQVLVAGDGEDALSLATRAKAPIHLLLTDVVLPKLSGAAVAERIRVTHPRIKVLFMSGYTDDAISHHGVLQPGVALLQKPFTPGELTRRVGEILDGL
jgi:PAS domain S-box-containing protein